MLLDPAHLTNVDQAMPTPQLLLLCEIVVARNAENHKETQQPILASHPVLYALLEGPAIRLVVLGYSVL